MAVSTPICDFGWKAPDFTLPGVDGETYALKAPPAGKASPARGALRGERGTLVMFICNHCPYVLAVIDRIVRDAKDLAPLGIASVAICSNDAVAYPDDSFANMALFSRRHGLPFPYLHDESQAVARAYDAVCTPEFFGFNKDLELQYRGRLDASRREAGGADLRRELFEAMTLVAETGQGPEEQFASMGCSIKWKAPVA